MLESISAMLHKYFLTCVSKPARFLYTLTKNLTAQFTHPNLCGVAFTNYHGGLIMKSTGSSVAKGIGVGMLIGGAMTLIGSTMKQQESKLQENG